MRPARTAAVLAASVLAVAGAGVLLRRAHDPRLPPLSELRSGPFAMQDATLAAGGFRAAAADLAWIQLLQYAAGNAAPGLEDEPGKPYSRMKELSLRVGRLDPSFHRALLYGAGMLGWFHGVERPDEAAEILEEGMRRSPEQPSYALYLAALAFKRKGEADKMIALLESVFDDPQTPTTMKTILANIHSGRGDDARALVLWERLLANPRDEAEHPRARHEITKIRSRLRSRR